MDMALHDRPTPSLSLVHGVIVVLRANFALVQTTLGKVRDVVRFYGTGVGGWWIDRRRRDCQIRISQWQWLTLGLASKLASKTIFTV